MMGFVPAELTLRPMIGRGAELSRLLELVGLADGAATTPGAVRVANAVVISGDAGVGKSRMLAELRDHAVRADWQVLIGHCLDFGDSALPYLPFTEAFGRLAAEEPELSERLVRTHPAVRRLMPGQRLTVDVSAGSSGESARPNEPMDRAGLFASVLAVLDELATASPVLLLLEDLHWADQSTRELLSFLFARQLPDDVHIVATYRSDDLHRKHPLRAAVADWSRLPTVERLPLERLSDRDVRSLVQALHPASLSEATIHTIVERAEGNAFFTEELVAATGRSSRALPDDLADVLLLRLDQLGDAARQTLRAASVAGRRVSHELLARVVDLPGAELDRAIRATVDNNLLLPVGTDSYAFRHALLAEAVYEDLLPGERVRLHRAYAAALQEPGVRSTAAEIARHARASHDLATAVKASIAAGDEAMSIGGPDEAAEHLERALEMVGDGGDEPLLTPTERVTLAVKAAEAVATAGHTLRSVQLLVEQLAILRDEVDDLDRARLLYALATAALVVDTDLDVLGTVDKALALVPAEPPTPLRAQLLSTQARVLVAFGREAQAVEAANEALAMGQELRVPGVIVDATTTLTRMDERSGDPENSQRRLLEIVSKARANDDPANELRALHNIGSVLFENGRINDARQAYATAMDRALELGRPWAPYGMEARLMGGIAAYVAGDWDDSVRILDRASNSPPPPAEAALASAVLQVHASRGDRSALDTYAHLRPLWDTDGLFLILTGMALIDLHGDHGDLDASIAAHDATVEAVSRLWESSFFLARVRLSALMVGQLASSAAGASADEREAMVERGGELAEIAEEAYARGLRRWKVVGPEGQAWMLRLRAEQARLLWSAGSADAPEQKELIRGWEDAVDAFAAFHHVFEVARSQARLAAILRATGDAAGARPHLSAARTTAEQLKAEPMLAELRSLGSTAPRRADADGNDTRLTTREREILGLVAQGRTNGEIGKQLFISTKTVSVHVSNILAKLGASGRTEAAAIARRDGLLD
jgi:DNA-binding CsgD family transcriptional regulator/tetratricopeptide (TPR) repeat protein